MAEKILVRVARNFGYLGIIAGAYCGFLARDEYNFSTFSRIHELCDEYNQKQELLDLEVKQIQKELKRVAQEKEQALKDMLKTTKKQLKDLESKNKQ
ncbi:transmembrane protein, putative (macronuclear) [Tetrahymena thermophila SB210]|uniref:Transmembrane protein, putative n=1 Tax=Tetrahymena thermophila (strain SB210) TaxID=312017 RepID=I7LT78_TETTS|nr:transmembrane protein, putative [Tetrahymena thermophila SB210]EAR84644.1 transmembrane protein, putative [Tetrahymena thermophila SB210]|eukprot:XP_001032307.1 transmembrane protein, putative [Tetrahymena thermophila SB210]